MRFFTTFVFAMVTTTTEASTTAEQHSLLHLRANSNLAKSSQLAGALEGKSKKKTCTPDQAHWAYKKGDVQATVVSYSGDTFARCVCNDGSSTPTKCHDVSTNQRHPYPDNDYFKKWATCGNLNALPTQEQGLYLKKAISPPKAPVTGKVMANWAHLYYKKDLSLLTCPHHNICDPKRTETMRQIKNYPRYYPNEELGEVLKKVNVGLDLLSAVGSAASFACGPAKAVCSVASKAKSLEMLTDPVKGAGSFLFGNLEANTVQDLCKDFGGFDGTVIRPEQFSTCIWNAVGSIVTQLAQEKVDESEIRSLQHSNDNLLQKLVEVTEGLNNARNSTTPVMETSRQVSILRTVKNSLYGAYDANFRMKPATSSDSNPQSYNVESTVALATRAELEVRVRQLAYLVDCEHQTEEAFDDVAEAIQGFIDEIERRVPLLKEARMRLIGDVTITQKAKNWQVERAGFDDNTDGSCPYHASWYNGMYQQFVGSYHYSCGWPGAKWPQPKTGPVWEHALRCHNEHTQAIAQQQDEFWSIYVGAEGKVASWKRAKREWLAHKGELSCM